MYINFEFSKKQGFNLQHVIAIQLIHQNSSGKMEPFLNEIEDYILNDLFRQMLITFVNKKKKTDTNRTVVRLSKKGKKLYSKLTSYAFEEGDDKVFEFTASVYKDLGKIVGSRTKVVKLITALRLESGLSAKKIYFICKEAVNSPDFMEYSHKLENLFFKGSNVYAKFNLGDSKLFEYYEQNYDEFDWNKKDA